MKRNIILLFLVLFIGMMLGIEGAYADVEPHQYKEKEIKIKTEYFHDESLLKRKDSLPDELKDLTFSGEGKLESEKAKEVVFQSAFNQKSMIEEKAEQLQLFSVETDFKQVNDYVEKERSIGILQIVLILTVALCVVGIFVLATTKMNTSARK